MELTDKAKNEKTSYWWVLFAAIIGALVAGIGYPPILFIIDYLFVALGIIIYLPNCNSLECVGMVYLGPICSAWLPAVGMGALGGVIGAGVTHKGNKRFRSWIGAVIGGLGAALMVATFVEIVNFSIWS